MGVNVHLLAPVALIREKCPRWAVGSPQSQNKWGGEKKDLYPCNEWKPRHPAYTYLSHDTEFFCLWPTDLPTDRLTDWLTDRPTDWLTDWLTDRLTGWLTDWPTDWLTDRLMTDWLTDWLNDWPSDWLTDRPTDWPTDWLTNAMERRP